LKEVDDAYEYENGRLGKKRTLEQTFFKFVLHTTKKTAELGNDEAQTKSAVKCFIGSTSTHHSLEKISSYGKSHDAMA
jgi:hypothetical protein